MEVWRSSTAATLMFEAAVAGAIPVITTAEAISCGKPSDRGHGYRQRHDEFYSDQDGAGGIWSSAEALALATKLGYAEADPTADIEGLDAARKVAILASIAFNSRVTIEDVNERGNHKASLQMISAMRRRWAAASS